jgi:hypothetical protein
MPGAALLLLERLIASEDRCDRLQGKLNDARERAARLELDLRRLEEHWAPESSRRRSLSGMVT